MPYNSFPWLFLFWASSCAHAAADLSFEPNTAIWAAGSLRSINEAPLNPGNLLARAPRESESVEIRPDWKLSGEHWKLTARPRLILNRDRVRAGGSTSTEVLALSRWSEGFGTWNASNTLTLDYGLQNFQWGPAESSSPSNRIFRDTVQVKDSLYVVRGHHLLRLSFAPSSSFSEVLLLEPTGNGDAEPEPNEPHSLKAALKSELSWAGGANYAGVVTGWRDHSGYWLGEYLNLEVLDGFFAYLDASEQAGNLAYYPVRDPRFGFISYTQSHRYDTALTLFTVSGLRYAFENGNDLRVEWIRQGAGYSTEELGRAAAALGSRDTSQLAVIAAQAPAARSSGLDFPGTNYLFSSIRFPNVFSVHDWTIYLREMESLQDHSSSGFLSTENSVGDHGTLIGGVAATLGRDGGELKGVVDLAATLAYRHAW